MDKLFSNAWYDRLKFAAQFLLPALATFYLTLGNTWDLANADKVATTIVAVNVFLGAVLGISAKQFNNNEDNLDGELTINGFDPNTGLPDVGLRLTTDPVELLPSDVKVVRLKAPSGAVVPGNDVAA